MSKNTNYNNDYQKEFWNNGIIDEGLKKNDSKNNARGHGPKVELSGHNSIVG